MLFSKFTKFIIHFHPPNRRRIDERVGDVGVVGAVVGAEWVGRSLH